MKYTRKNVNIVANNFKVRKTQVKFKRRYTSRSIGKKEVFCYNKVDSTNIIAKKLAIGGAEEGVAIIANEQTAGKGRLGRTFLSKRGGVYFSVILKPNIAPDDTLFITVAAAVAAARAIESVSGKICQIKWVNDIYINNKKVCGILTEGVMQQNGVLAYAILGVGINLFEPRGGFSRNLPLADSVFHTKDKKMFKNRIKQRVVSEFLKEFFSSYQELSKKQFISEYQQRSFLTGKKITYEKDTKLFTATVEGIDNNANLIVKVDNETKVLSSGEIQIVGMEQLPI